jgi:hypothetical protein
VLRPVSRSARLRAVVVAGLFSLSWSTSLLAQTSPDDRVSAEECCLHLLFHVGARAVALGNALTARSGADALFVNPAGLAALGTDEFRVHSSQTEIETATAFTLAFRIRGAGTVGVTYRLVDLGDIESTDGAGAVIGMLRLLDHSLLASFAAVMAPGLSAGVSYKLYQSRQDCRGSCMTQVGTTHGVDLGMQYHPPVWPALQLGASVIHMGTALQMINAEQADPMPVRIRAGAAYELMHHFTSDSTTALWATLDVAGSWRQGVDPIIAAGAELVLDGTVFVRSGYSTGTGRTAGAAVGVGLRYDRFDIGVAKTFVSGSGSEDPYQITFAISF